MNENVAFVGDVVELTLTAENADGTPHDLTAYDAVKILWQLPRRGGFLSLDATKPNGGADGVARCTTAPGQLNLAGNWQTQIAGYKNGVAWRHSARFAVQVDPVVT